MLSAPLTARARRARRARGAAFVTATVVRVEHPTSARAGNVALVHEDGTIEGFVGGVCAQHSVRLYSLKAIEPASRCCSGSSLTAPASARPRPRRRRTPATRSRTSEGAVTVQQPVPVGRRDRGVPRAVRCRAADDRRRRHADRRRAAPARPRSSGSTWSLPAARTSGPPAPCADDLALIVAAHGRDERAILRAASRRRSATSAWWPAASAAPPCSRSCAPTASPRQLLERIDSPAGLDIGARIAGRDRALDPGRDRSTVRRRDATRPSAAAALACGRRRRRQTADRPDLRDDGRRRARTRSRRARRRDRLLLLRGLQADLRAPAAAA